MSIADHPQSDLAWLAANGIELFNRYRGRWIAVKDRTVIAVGDTATEVDKNARRVDPAGQFILEAIEHDVDRV